MVVREFDQKINDFIKSLGIETGPKTVRHVVLLGQFGSQLRMPYSKKLSADLFELRIRGRQEVRIFYTFHKSEAVLLHGFIKKTQKTPQREIDISITKLKLLTAE